MRPDSGGRVELKLVESDGEGASYEVTLFDPTGEWTAAAKVRAGGAVEVAAWSPANPPAWLDALALTLLRGAQRAQKADAAWPRRVTRWRPGPEEQA